MEANVRETKRKPFTELAEFRQIVKSAHRAGLAVRWDADLIFLESQDGTVFNDTLDYDTLNYADDWNRKENLAALRHIIRHYKTCKKTN